DGRVVLIDFGLALRSDASSITSKGAIPGTLAYLAPEVVRGCRASYRSDVYGLGAVLYEMLAGVPPFDVVPAEALIYSILHTQPERITVHRADIHPHLERIVLRAIARNPIKRYATAGELAAELSV